MPPNPQRQTAYLVSIGLLKRGQYKVEEGWQPNYVLLPGEQKVSRVNCMGIVVDYSEGANEFLFDDGTGTIRVRTFEDDTSPLAVKVGDPIILIGRPRIYSAEIYIFPEIVKKLKNPAWITYRKKELDLLEKDVPESISAPAPPDSAPPDTPPAGVEEEANQIEEETIEESPAEKMTALIKSLDQGDGAATEDVIGRYNEQGPEKNGETVIDEMLKRGQLFEIKGRLKVLE